MKSLRWRMMCAVAACGAGCLMGPAARAQSFGGGSPSLGDPSTGATSAAAPGLATPSTGGSFTMTPNIPLFAPAVPNPMSDPTAAGMGSSTQNNMMNSPFAAPFIYSSMMQAAQPLGMYGASTASSTASTTASSTAAARYGMMGGMNPGQLGMMMLMTQNTGGVGSGQMSGARPGTPTAPTARTAATSKRRSAAKPGGLAARYFNRPSPHTPYPQSYFNRQSRYFP